MRKKILSLALAIAVCLGLTVPTFAAETKSIMLEKYGIVMTMYGYLRTERYKTEDDGITTVYVVEDGSAVELKAMDGFQYITDEELSEHEGAFFDYVAVHGSGLGSGYACDITCSPLTKPVSVTIDPKPLNSPEYGYGGFIYYNCTVICESDLAWVLDGAERIPNQPDTPPAGIVASPTNDKLTVNGKLADPTVYKIDGSNYFKIRDVAALLDGTEKQFAVGYDGALKSVTATTGQGYTKLDTDLLGAPAGGNKTADPSNDAIYINGEKIDAVVYKIDGGNYFKLRDLGKALNFSVDWNREQGMMIDTSKSYTE